MSFIEQRAVREGLTFDDVLLVPAYSEVQPREVSLKSRFSRNISLNVPIVSAAMDTVTEAPMAIAIAREGGIGVIHKNMSIAEQAAQVRLVKRAENGMITDPAVITADKTIGDALEMMRINKIGGIPVVDEKGTLVGIVTNRDLRFQEDHSVKIAEVMTSKNLITILDTEFKRENVKNILLKHRIEKLPVVNAEGKLVGLVTYKDMVREQNFPNACKDPRGRLRVAAGIGITDNALERVDALVAEGVDAVVLDCAHGHSKSVIEKLKAIKAKYPELDVVVGNIATGAAARDLIAAGADALKVGIGPG